MLAQSKSEQQNHLSTEDAIADLNYLITTVEAVHFNPFLHTSKETWNIKKEEVLASWSKKDTISSADFTLKIMSLLGLINCGHTNLKWYSSKLIQDKKSKYFFPLSIKVDEDQQLVILDSLLNKKHPNASLLKINGKNALQFYNSALASLGGNLNYRQQLVEDLFFSIYLYLSGIEAPYHLEFENGTSTLLQQENCINFISLWQRLKGNQKDYEFQILEEKIAYVAYNNCNDYERFETFLKKAFTTIHEAEIQKLIIDVRRNSGGDSSLNDLLLSYLTKKPYRQMSRRLWKYSEIAEQTLIRQGYKEYFGDGFIQDAKMKHDSTFLEFNIGDGFVQPENSMYFFEGKSCLLIGAGTYSSANMLADAMSTFEISTLIGQPTGQWTTDFGEMAEFSLPNTNFPFTVAMTLDVGANANADEFKPVFPDIQIEDDVLIFAKEWILKQ